MPPEPEEGTRCPKGRGHPRQGGWWQWPDLAPGGWTLLWGPLHRPVSASRALSQAHLLHPENIAFPAACGGSVGEEPSRAPSSPKAEVQDTANPHGAGSTREPSLPPAVPTLSGAGTAPSLPRDLAKAGKDTRVSPGVEAGPPPPRRAAPGSAAPVRSVQVAEPRPGVC